MTFHISKDHHVIVCHVSICHFSNMPCHQSRHHVNQLWHATSPWPLVVRSQKRKSNGQDGFSILISWKRFIKSHLWPWLRPSVGLSEPSLTCSSSGYIKTFEHELGPVYFFQCASLVPTSITSFRPSFEPSRIVLENVISLTIGIHNFLRWNLSSCSSGFKSGISFEPDTSYKCEDIRFSRE